MSNPHQHSDTHCTTRLQTGASFKKLNNNNNNNPFNCPLSRMTPVSWYQKNIHSLTPCLCRYYTTSLINFLHFLWSTAHLSGQSITPSFMWPASMSYTFYFIIHAFFTQPFSSLLKKCPYHLNLCRCITVIISPISSLSLNSLHKNLSVTLTPHIHLIILISAH